MHIILFNSLLHVRTYQFVCVGLRALHIANRYDAHQNTSNSLHSKATPKPSMIPSLKTETLRRWTNIRLGRQKQGYLRYILGLFNPLALNLENPRLKRR